MLYLKPHNPNEWNQSWTKSDKSKWLPVATIPHHGSSRQKHSTESECVYIEKGSWSHGKRTPCKMQTYEIRQHLHRSREKTPKQKSVEDNYANGLYSSQSLTTSDFKRKKICHRMSGAGQHGRRINKRRTETTRNYCCQENLGELRPICDDN